MTDHLHPLVSDLINIAPDAFLIVSSDGRIDFANKGASELTGYAHDQLIGMHIDIMVPQAHRPNHARHFQSFMDRGADTYLMSRRGSIPLRTQDGSIREVGASISKKWMDGKLFFGVILTDLTPLKTALQAVVEREQALQDSLERLERAEERFMLAQKLANIGSWDWQIATGDLFWSDEVYRIFGLEPKELSPTYDAFLSFIHPDDRSSVERAVAASLEVPTLRYDIKHRIVQPNGNIRIVREIGKTEVDETGKPRMMIGSVQDITEIEQLQEHMETALLRETEANRSKTEFLANLSHELRTPLNAVVGYSSLIPTLPHNDTTRSKIDEYAGDIHMAGRHLSDLVEDILEMSKIDLGIVDLQEEEIDLTATIRMVQSITKARADEKGLTLDHDLADNLPHLYGDELRLKQILLNLVTNSIKFTDRGGHVSLWAGTREDNGIRIIVADNGCGMEKHRIADAIKKFTRLHPALKSDYQGGLGLGLSMVKAYCDLHGAGLTIDSDIGQGTRVTIDFPADRTCA